MLLFVFNTRVVAGIAENRKRGHDLFVKCMEANQPIGICGLACCYSNGWHVGKDKLKAVELLKKSAALGYSGAMCNLGHEYARAEDGVEQHWEQSVHWYVCLPHISLNQLRFSSRVFSLLIPHFLVHFHVTRECVFICC